MLPTAAIALAIALAVASTVAGCGGATEQPRLSRQERAGAQVFLEARCGNCHVLGPYSGVGGSNLDRRKPSLDTVVQRVTFGSERGMPAYAGALTEREIRQVAAYVVRVSRR